MTSNKKHDFNEQCKALDYSILFLISGERNLITLSLYNKKILSLMKSCIDIEYFDRYIIEISSDFISSRAVHTGSESCKFDNKNAVMLTRFEKRNYLLYDKHCLFTNFLLFERTMVQKMVKYKFSKISINEYRHP